MSLTDWLIEKVTVNLGGQEWRLAITYRVLLECENLTGFDMLRTVDILVNPTATSLRTLLTCILRRVDPGLSCWRVGSLLGPGDMPKVEEAIRKAYVASMPKPEKRRVRQKKKGETEETKPEPPMDWLQTRSAAHEELRLSADDWQDMTPLEFHALREAHVKALRQSELMIGQLIAAVKNHSMNPPKKWQQASDFVLHRLPADEPEAGCAQIDRRTGAISFQA